MCCDIFYMGRVILINLHQSPIKKVTIVPIIKLAPCWKAKGCDDQKTLMMIYGFLAGDYH